MKKCLFVFFLFTVLFSGLSVCAQNVIIDMGLGEKREVPVKGEGAGDDIWRRPVEKPLQVFICGNQLTVDFFSPISSVTITVTNVSTNKVVFWDVYNMPGAAMIDLSDGGAGEYQVKITLTSSCLWGDFSIK